jgi:hypothetical protein
MTAGRVGRMEPAAAAGFEVGGAEITFRALCRACQEVSGIRRA